MVEPKLSPIVNCERPDSEIDNVPIFDNLNKRLYSHLSAKNGIPLYSSQISLPILQFWILNELLDVIDNDLQLKLMIDVLY